MTYRNLLLILVLAISAIARSQDKILSSPVIVLSANDVTSGVMQPGLPLLVGALSTVEEGDAPNLPTNLSVKLVDSKGASLGLTFTRIVRAKETNQFYWMLADTATNNLKPGHYNVVVDEAGGKIAGWTLEGCDLEVNAKDDSNADLKSQLDVELLLIQNKLEEALKVATAQTQKDPKNINAWVAVGDIYMLQDKPEEALLAYESALANFKDDGHEPLAILQRYRDALMKIMPPATN